MSRLSNIVASFFAQARINDGAILDVGCGTGTFGNVLTAVRRTKKPFLVGCDIYKPYLRMLSPNIYDGVVQASATHLPFKDRSFNNVVSIAVIEHLEKINGVRMSEDNGACCKK
jgi:ubiquinone/menaquinone biosynthesis C-methylase UbiE